MTASDNFDGELVIRLQIFADHYLEAKMSDAPSANMAEELKSMVKYIAANRTKLIEQIMGETIRRPKEYEDWPTEYQLGWDRAIGQAAAILQRHRDSQPTNEGGTE